VIREVIKPEKNVYILNLPDEMVGKTVEVIAFEIENAKEEPVKTNNTLTIQDVMERYSRYPLISHDSYQFNRDEANDYE